MSPALPMFGLRGLWTLEQHAARKPNVGSAGLARALMNPLTLLKSHNPRPMKNIFSSMYDFPPVLRSLEVCMFPKRIGPAVLFFAARSRPGRRRPANDRKPEQSIQRSARQQDARAFSARGERKSLRFGRCRADAVGTRRGDATLTARSSVTLPPASKSPAP